MEDPVFWGRIAPDVTFVGFDLVREDVEPAPGWYFVIAEQPTGPRFGLDVPTGGNSRLRPRGPISTGDTSAPTPASTSRSPAAVSLNSTKPLAPGAPSATFGRNSADMAAITFQRPFRAVVHTSELLDGADGIGAGVAATGPVEVGAAATDRASREEVADVAGELEELARIRAELADLAAERRAHTVTASELRATLGRFARQGAPEEG